MRLETISLHCGYTDAKILAKDTLKYVFASEIQCNLDLVTLLVSAKTVTKSHIVTKSNDFM